MNKKLEWTDRDDVEEAIANVVEDNYDVLAQMIADTVHSIPAYRLIVMQEMMSRYPGHEAEVALWYADDDYRGPFDKDGDRDDNWLEIDVDAQAKLLNVWIDKAWSPKPRSDEVWDQAKEGFKLISSWIKHQTAIDGDVVQVVEILFDMIENAVGVEQVQKYWFLRDAKSRR